MVVRLINPMDPNGSVILWVGCLRQKRSHLPGIDKVNLYLGGTVTVGRNFSISTKYFEAKVSRFVVDVRLTKDFPMRFPDTSSNWVLKIHLFLKKIEKLCV